MNDEKELIKNNLSLNDIYSLLIKYNANPILKEDSIIADTICHNEPNAGSKKLYYYDNTKLFQCYTNCDFFDVFDLIVKVYKIQYNQEIGLNEATSLLVKEFGLNFSANQFEFQKPELYNEKILKKYQELHELSFNKADLILPSYEKRILDVFNYPRIKPWEDAGISNEIIKLNRIGYCPSTEQITIPHFDENNNLVGIRGRSLITQEAERYGKYRPLYVSNTLYNHPLSLNLYNLNNSKENISKFKSAIIFEGKR